jgi:short-subunit dehydrogenase
MTLAGYPVKVTTVYPSGIATAIARNATAAEGLDKDELAELFDTRLAGASPERAAQIILNGVRRNKARVLVGPGAGALDLFVRVTGSGYQRILPSIVGRVMPRADTDCARR